MEREIPTIIIEHINNTKRNISAFDYNVDYNAYQIKKLGDELFHYGNPEFLKAVITYIANDCKVNMNRKKKQETIDRQNRMIDYCKELITKL